VVAIRVRVRGGAARVVPELVLQDLHYLEVGYVVFIVNACVIPAFRSTRVRVRTPTVTTLLIYRSLGICGVA
jgi:hypothetical protein